MGWYGGGTKVSSLVVDGDLDMGSYDIKADDIKESTGAAGVTIDSLGVKDGQIISTDALSPANTIKIASANLRNSHDAEVAITGSGSPVLAVKKVMTFTNGISGVLTVKYDMKVDHTSYDASGKLYKNGVDLGGALKVAEATSYVTQSEDIDVGVIAPGETLELWAMYDRGAATAHIENFRCYYDNGDMIACAETDT